METKRKITLLAAAFLAVGFLILRFYTAIFDRTVMLDFSSFYYASLEYFRHGNIYNADSLNLLAQAHGISFHVFPYLYPPPLAFWMYPFGWVNPLVASKIWMILSIIFAIFILLASIRLFESMGQSSSRKNLFRWLALAMFVIFPFVNNIRIGQVNIFVLSLIVLSLLCAWSYGLHFISGFLFAFAVLIKCTPVLLIFLFLKEPKKFFLGLATGLVLLVLPTVATENGMRQWVEFFDFSQKFSLGYSIPGLFPLDVPWNFSIAGWTARFTTDPSLRNFISMGILGAFSIVLIVLFKRRTQPELLLPLSVFMIMVSPFAYLHHIIFIFPGAVMCLYHLLQKDRFPLFQIGFLFILVGLVSFDFPLYYDKFGIFSGVWKSLNLYLLIAFFLLGIKWKRNSNNGTVIAPHAH